MWCLALLFLSPCGALVGPMALFRCKKALHLRRDQMRGQAPLGATGCESGCGLMEPVALSLVHPSDDRLTVRASLDVIVDVANVRYGLAALESDHVMVGRVNADRTLTALAQSPRGPVLKQATVEVRNFLDRSDPMRPCLDGKYASLEASGCFLKVVNATFDSRHRTTWVGRPVAGLNVGFVRSFNAGNDSQAYSLFRVLPSSRVLCKEAPDGNSWSLLEDHELDGPGRDVRHVARTMQYAR